MYQFPIRNRWTGAVQFECELSAETAGSEYSVQLGYAIKKGVAAGANLVGADLVGANFAGANLADADLADAYLADAYLACADLADALKVDVADIPVIPHIDATILRSIEAGGSLDMGSWHGPSDHWCGTTHCRAGWAIHKAGERGKALQDKFGPSVAGALIYQASRPGKPSPWFFASNDEALADLRKCAAADPLTDSS
jgi:hypothetical protein